MKKKHVFILTVLAFIITCIFSLGHCLSSGEAQAEDHIPQFPSKEHSDAWTQFMAACITVGLDGVVSTKQCADGAYYKWVDRNIERCK